MFSHPNKTIDKGASTFKKRSYFDQNEAAFFSQIQQCLPNCRILPRLPLSSLMGMSSVKDKASSKLATLPAIIVDYTIFNQRWEAVCVILIERQQEAGDLRKVLQIFELAKIAYFHWHETDLPDAKQLTTSLQAFLHLGSNTLIPQCDEGILTEQSSKRTTRNSDPNAHFGLHEPDHPDAISLKVLRQITPGHQLRDHYPHIWKRVFSLLGNPKQLKHYLLSLISNRDASEQQGLPQEAIDEVIAIKNENQRHLDYLAKIAVWHDTEPMNLVDP
ncbi:MAG: hypothetical protein K2P84_14195 [Undibacterium sp.]|nr:hypothetical protein [Undibacterium sp.]